MGRARQVIADLRAALESGLVAVRWGVAVKCIPADNLCDCVERNGGGVAADELLAQLDGPEWESVMEAVESYGWTALGLRFASSPRCQAEMPRSALLGGNGGTTKLVLQSLSTSWYFVQLLLGRNS